MKIAKRLLRLTRQYMRRVPVGVTAIGMVVVIESCAGGKPVRTLGDWGFVFGCLAFLLAHIYVHYERP